MVLYGMGNTTVDSGSIGSKDERRRSLFLLTKVTRECLEVLWVDATSRTAR